MTDQTRAQKVLEFLRTADDKEVENWADFCMINIGDPNNTDNGLDDAIIEERNENGFRVTGMCHGDTLDYEEFVECFVSWNGELEIITGPKEFVSTWKYLGDIVY